MHPGARRSPTVHLAEDGRGTPDVRRHFPPTPANPARAEPMSGDALLRRRTRNLGLVT